MVLSLCPAEVSVESERPDPAPCLSFQQFVKAHETAVFTFCYRMLSSTSLAETAAETAFWDACPRFPAVSLVDVLAAARGRCLEVLQHYGRLGETAVTDIQYLFNQLPIPEREVMALRYGCKLNFAEIAAILNSSGEIVRNTLRQGRWRVANLDRGAR